MSVQARAWCHRANAADPGCASCMIRHRSFCSVLDDQEIVALESIVDEMHVAPGQVIFYDRDPAEHIFNLLSGTIKTYKLLQDGRRQILGFSTAGDLLGQAAAARYNCVAEAITEATYCRFSRTRLRAVSARYPMLEKKLLEITANELRAAHDQIMALGRKSAPERIATFLLQLSDKAVREERSGNPVHLPMSRHDIADYLGLTPETVSRVLTQFAREGLVGIPPPDRIKLSRPAELRRRAEAENLRID